jgi:hypothetical protein
MSDDLTLWQQVLGAEHAAIYGYGLVGATDDMAEAASSALAVHRQRRAVCLEAVVALGGTPEASAPAYDVVPPADAARAGDAAAALEAACWPAYLGLAGSDDRRTRLTGAGWVRESTVRAQSWNGSVAPLPGLDA